MSSARSDSSLSRGHLVQSQSGVALVVHEDTLGDPMPCEVYMPSLRSEKERGKKHRQVQVCGQEVAGGGCGHFDAPRIIHHLWIIISVDLNVSQTSSGPVLDFVFSL